MPESKGRKKSDYTPPPEKKDRSAVRIGNQRWLAPVMVACFVIGLMYIVVFYIAGSSVPLMNALSPLINVLIGFAFITVGFILATRWH